MKRNRKSRPRLAFLRPLFFFLFLVGLVVALSNLPFWRVTGLSCAYNGSLCPAEVQGQLLSRLVGRNLLWLSTDQVKQSLLGEHPEFVQIEIKKKLINRLAVRIEFRKPVVGLARVDDQGQRMAGPVFLVDEGGFYLETVDQTTLPLVLASGVEPAPGDWLEDKNLLALVQILHQSALRLLSPETGKLLSPHSAEVTYRGGPVAVFSLMDELEKQLDSLQLILQRSKMSNGGLRKIDLRFEKPVVEE